MTKNVSVNKESRKGMEDCLLAQLCKLKGPYEKTDYLSKLLFFKKFSDSEEAKDIILELKEKITNETFSDVLVDGQRKEVSREKFAEALRTAEPERIKFMASEEADVFLYALKMLAPEEKERVLNIVPLRRLSYFLNVDLYAKQLIEIFGEVNLKTRVRLLRAGRICSCGSALSNLGEKASPEIIAELVLALEGDEKEELLLASRQNKKYEEIVNLIVKKCWKEKTADLLEEAGDYENALELRGVSSKVTGEIIANKEEDKK